MTMKTPLLVLLVPSFYTPNSDFWETVSNFSAHLYQRNPDLWERPSSGCKGKTCCSSGHMTGSNAMLTSYWKWTVNEQDEI